MRRIRACVAAALALAVMFGSSIPASAATVYRSPASPAVAVLPPAPQGLTASGVSETSILVSWTIPTEADGDLWLYTVYWDDGLQHVNVDRTRGSFIVTALSPGTTYRFFMTATDTSGNESVPSAVVSATTLTPVQDDTPPSAPTGLSATEIGSTSVALSWNASTDSGSGVAAYEIYTRQGSSTNLVAMLDASVTSFTVTNLLPSTGYTFYLVAVDGAYNRSADSEPLSVTTLAPPPARMVPVYRFYNVTAGTHFYTADGAEMERVRATLGATYTYEGIAYTINADNPANSIGLYRFYNRRTGTHLYTADAVEAFTVMAKYADTYTYEGYAYHISLSTGIAVHRFFNPMKGVHFYSSDPSEIAYVRANLGQIWTYEGPAYNIGQ